MSRICPDCNVDLSPKAFLDLALDVCPRCAGIFFDDGEVARLKEKGVAAMAQLDESLTPTEPAERSATRARLCPCCQVGMDKFHYMYNSNLILDECEKCGGIWVQDGDLLEMRKILEEYLSGPSNRRGVKALTAHATPVHPSRIQRVREFLAGLSSTN